MKLDHEKDLERLICENFCALSKQPWWQWWEQHIKLDQTSASEGNYSTELFPMARSFATYAQAPETRRLTVVTSAQSIKTQCGINALLASVKLSPAPTMWIGASLDSAEEFAKKRLFPAIEDCEPVSALLPKNRTERSKRLIQFATMNLLLRGSNSRIGIRSDPIRRIFCDERADWKAGSIFDVRKRLRTFHNSIEISMGTAGVEHDELHNDFLEGSQTFFHWPCLDCGHEQPFRFGRKANSMYPAAREKGGMRWEENDATRPNGRWNWKELRKTVCYECEQCGRRYLDHEKFPLIRSLREWHRNPDALPKYVSLHWSTIYMPWSSCDWADITIEFLRASQHFEWVKV